ncbi:hypothetical protein BB341_07420 [Streptomyces clavuligerus]|nr:hypothetical protein BB341_07420 [Streptomyces clavuligerus]
MLVTHSGFFDAVQELLNGGGSRVELKVAHTGITQWEYRPGCFGGSWLLHRHNIVPGLSPLPSPTPDGPGNPGGTEPNT